MVRLWLRWAKMRAEWKRKRALKTIRCEMAWWGFSLDNLSDEEIEKRLKDVTKAIADTGFTIEELSTAIAELSKATAGFAKEFKKDEKESEVL